MEYKAEALTGRQYSTKMIIYSRSRAAEKSRERGRGRQFQFFTNLLLWKEIIRCVADFTGMISSPLV